MKNNKMEKVKRTKELFDYVVEQLSIGSKEFRVYDELKEKVLRGRVQYINCKLAIKNIVLFAKKFEFNKYSLFHVILTTKKKKQMKLAKFILQKIGCMLLKLVIIMY